MAPSAKTGALPFWPVALVLLLAAGTYANALCGVFLFDDLRDVVENPSAQAANFFARLAAMNRAATKASYALQDWIHGPWAAAYHAVNVALHLLACLALLALLRRAGRFGGLATAEALWLAVAVTAVWALHPALSETVSYVSGRSAGFSGLLMLTALIAASGPQSAPIRTAAFLCALVAALARETALVLPAILLWWQVTLQPREDFRDAVLRFMPVALGAALGAVLIALSARHRELIEASLAARPPLEALRGNLFAASDIIGFWFMPWRVTILPAPPVIHGWLEVAALWRITAFGGIALTAIVLRRRTPLIAFGLGLALLALAPSNSILWRADPVGLKPLYLAGLGLTLALGAATMSATRLSRAVALALGAVALVFGAMSVQRNALFADPVALWRDAAEKTPDEARPLVLLAFALVDAGRVDEAMATLRAALEIDPFDQAARNALDLLASMRGVDGAGGEP